MASCEVVVGLKGLQREIYLTAFISSKHRNACMDTAGSTSIALLDLLQKTTDMLRDNEYVEIISIDFTRAFNPVRHHARSLKYLLL